MNSSPSFLSSNLRYLRHMSHLSQEDIAERIGISRNMYIRYESGESEPPVDRLYSLSKLFGVPLSALTNSDLQNASPWRHGFDFLDNMNDLIRCFESLSAVSRKIIMEEIRLLREIESEMYRNV